MNGRSTAFVRIVPVVASAIFLAALGAHGLLTAVLTLPLLGLVVLGVGLLRAAIPQRSEGWSSGVLLGAILALFGVGGLIGLLSLGA